MNSEKIAILQRALTREKAARKEAEKILEKKAAELYALTQELSETNTRLRTRGEGLGTIASRIITHNI